MSDTLKITNQFMEIALKEAKLAKERDEKPVGAVIIDKNKNILASNGNRVIELSDPTAHAEILCIREASKKLKNERLIDCTIFSSLEPCVMCASAISYARIGYNTFFTLFLFPVFWLIFNLYQMSFIGSQDA